MEDLQGMSLRARLDAIRSSIARAALASGRQPADVTLVAATKTQSSDRIREAIAAGVTVCGENRVQELTSHLADYAYDGEELHFIGNLQTNKVKQVVGRVDLIESVDSLRLLQAISHHAETLGIVQDVLLEVNIAGEASKGGLAPAEVLPLAEMARGLPHVRLRGLMCIPPPSQNEGDNRPFFAATRQLLIDIKQKMGDNGLNMDHLSMGMSSDYEDAILEGATLVRIGTALFGPRISPA